MYKSIKVALEYLPEEFVTQEMVNEAVKCKDVEVLSYIPQRFLNTQLIEQVIANCDNCWHSFKLKHIPEECRTESVCAYAVKKNWRTGGIDATLKNLSHLFAAYRLLLVVAHRATRHDIFDYHLLL